MADLKIQGVVEVSTEGAESSLNRVGDAAGRMSGKVQTGAEKAGKAVDGIGNGAGNSAEKFTRAEARISDSIKRATRNLEMLGKTASQKLELNIAAKGLDPAKFETSLAKLRQLEAAQNSLHGSTTKLGSAYGDMANSLSSVAVAAAAVAAGTTFVQMIRGAIDAADSMNDLSKSTSISVEMLAGLKLASKQSGAELEGTAQAINKLSVKMGENAEKFAAIGITAKDPIEAFKQLSDVFRSIEDPQKRAAFGAEALGKSWASAAPLLSEGSAKIQEMVDKGTRLSGMTQAVADDADAFNDAMAEMSAGIDGAAMRIAGDMLPVLIAMSKDMSDVSGSASEMDDSFSPIAETLRAVAVLGGNVAYVIKGIGVEIGGLAAQAAALARFDFSGALRIGDMMKTDAASARTAFDAWESGVMGAARTAKVATGDLNALAGASTKAIDTFIGGNAKVSDGVNKAAREAERLQKAIYDLRNETVISNAKEAEKELDALTKAEAEYAKALYAADDALVAKAAALEYEVQYYGQAESAINATIVARLEEARAMAAANGAYPEHLAFLDREIEARNRIASASSQKEILDANDKAAKEAAKDWEKASDDINRALTDALMRGFESGKSFGENFVDSLKNSLKTAALKIVVNVVTSTGGSVVNAAINAVAGTGGANGGAGTSGIGGIANNVSTLSSVYGYGQAAYAGYGMTAAEAQAAAALYSEAGKYGTSWAMQAGNYAGGLFGGSGAGAGAAGTYSAASTATTSLGNVATGVSGEVAAMAAGQGAAPATWGSMLGNAAYGAWVLAIPAIAGAISAAGSRKAYEFDGVAIKGDYAGSNFTGSAATKWEADGGWWESGDKMKKWMPLTDNKDAIIEAFFGGGTGAAGRTGYVNPVSGDYSKASDLANLGDLRDTPSFTGVDNSKAAAEWDAQYAAWQKANPRVWSGIGWSGSGEDWTGGDRPEEMTGNVWSGVGGMFGTVSRTPVLSTDPVMLAALDNAIDAIFKATQTSFKALADQFDDTDLAGKVNAFSTSINLDTKSGDIDKVLAALASDVNAKMAQAFLPSIETLRLPEEAWQAAFNRVMVEVAGTSRILDMMGASIKETFGADTNKAITAIDGLSKAFGGIDALSTSFSAYYANFYSQEEQRAQAMEDMGKSFDALNISMPKTREEFRAMVDGLDLATVGGQATFKSLMDLQGGFANLVPAITDVSTAVTDAADALAKDRAALIAARNEATEAASTSLSDMQAAFDDLQKSITQGTVNGNLGALAFSASEFDSISSFIGYIDEANVKLAEIAKSPFADELSNYTTQIKALAQSVQDQAADTLINSRMLVGDIAGAIAAEVSKTQIDQSTYMLSEQGGKPRRGDFATRSDFDAAFAKWTSPQFVASAYNMASEERSIKAALTIANQMSANALRIPNAGSVGSAPVGVSGEYRYKLMREIASEYGIGSQSVLEQTLASALESGVGKLLRSNYTATGPGIASVNAAVNNYNDASKTGYVDGKFLMGADAISFAEGMRSLDATLKAGRLSVVDYAKGVDFLTGTFGGAMGDINDARLAAGSMAGAMAAAGSASIVYYFDQIAQQVASLAKASEQAAEPISQAVLAIGRMNSASTVFGQSASAVMNGYLGMMGSAQGVMADAGSSDAQQRDALAMYASGSYGRDAAMQEGSDYRNAVLVSTAASVVSQIMTTQSAAEAAKLLAEKASFAGASNTQLRDASLLMDGLAQFDAVSLENVFNRLANALSTSKITEGQYVDMVSQSIDTFRGLDEETEAVKTAMQRLAESMGGFADKLLIDQSRTTIGATQTLAEIERQYSVARDSAKTGDENSISNYQSLANALLDKAMYDTQADYNDAFGKVYGDAKSLESVGVNTVAQINGDNVVTELKKMNTELSDRVESLERNLTTALAVIAKNTAKTSSGIEQINTVGLPA